VLCCLLVVLLCSCVDSSRSTPLTMISTSHNLIKAREIHFRKYAVAAFAASLLLVVLGVIAAIIGTPSCMDSKDADAFLFSRTLKEDFDVGDFFGDFFGGGDGDGALRYDIELDLRKVPNEYKGAFSNAVDRWESVIVGDIEDVVVTVNSAWCGPLTSKKIDDLLICVDVAPIDGPGKVVGFAGPEGIRSSNKLTSIGGMRFDQDDMALLVTRGIYEDIIVSHICESQRTH
jgi:hypothetical protein